MLVLESIATAVTGLSPTRVTAAKVKREDVIEGTCMLAEGSRMARLEQCGRLGVETLAVEFVAALGGF